MKLKTNLILFFLVFFIFNAVSVQAISNEEDDDIKMITKEELHKIINQPGMTLIDVRYIKNWRKSDKKIKGAIRENPNELSSWIGKYAKDQKIILYCD